MSHTKETQTKAHCVKEECAICTDELMENHATVRCPECEKSIHLDCLRKNIFCIIFFYDIEHIDFGFNKIRFLDDEVSEVSFVPF